MDHWKEYTRYGSGVFKRIKIIGISKTTSEFLMYYKKYKYLPEKMGFKSDLNYKLFVIYNYLKLTYYLPDETKEYIMNFVPRRIQTFLLPKINPLNKKYIVVDKVEFYRLASQHGYAIPRTYFYSKNNLLYNLEGNIITSDSLKELEGKTLFSKIIDGAAAVGAKKEVFSLSSLDLKEKRIFQDALETHDKIIELSPTKALNCVKISTYLKNDNSVHFQLSFIKLGGENSIVDNIGGASGGGIAIPIDHETGKLKGIGYKEVGNTLRVTNIPSTDKNFEGFTVPFYHEAVDLVKKAHKEVFYELKHIGWDVGITNSGPVLIEGNSGADMFAAQMICRPFNYYNDPLIQENLIKK